MRPPIIYGVCDPRSGELRYVGKTIHLLRDRLNRHLRDRGQTYRSHWFRQMDRLGLTPDIFEIEVVPSDFCWKETEQFWITYFRSLGCNLVNTSLGGDGATGIKDPPHVRLKKSLGMRGKKKSLSHRNKISEALTGKPGTRLGKRCSDLMRSKISAAQKGIPKGPPSASHRLALSVAMKGMNKGVPWSPARRESYERSRRG